MLLAVSCHHPKPAANWAGSRQNQRLALMRAFPQVSPEVAREVYPDVDEATVRASWPSTLDQAVARIIEGMDDTDKKLLRDTKKEDLILVHHGWGTGIRNEFGLWRGNTNLLSDCHAEHPDDASMVVIKAVWERLQKH